ncbi:hypothetical protein ACIQPQ_19045 [Streptomyces sp. NPDC091281]|uniref:hypothetical protein n=1 Tax=Streptomyces sp. NPDC091281 TaxID=3365985 RepID=UPI003821AEEC
MNARTGPGPSRTPPPGARLAPDPVPALASPRVLPVSPVPLDPPGLAGPPAVPAAPAVPVLSLPTTPTEESHP